MPASVLQFPSTAIAGKRRRTPAAVPTPVALRDHILRQPSVNPGHCVLSGYDGPRASADSPASLVVRLELPQASVTEATIDFLCGVLRAHGVGTTPAACLELVR